MLIRFLFTCILHATRMCFDPPERNSVDVQTGSEQGMEACRQAENASGARRDHQSDPPHEASIWNIFVCARKGSKRTLAAPGKSMKKQSLQRAPKVLLQASNQAGWQAGRGMAARQGRRAGKIQRIPFKPKTNDN